MTEPAPEKTRWGAWLDARFRSPAAIYGLIVFAAFVTISSDHADDAWEMLNTAAWTLIVFFIAHVFAHTLTDHGERGLRASIAHSVSHAAGMLWAALPATIALIVCGINGLSADDAYEATMWVTWVVLAVLGYVAYWRRGAHIVIRLLGAAGTAALGIAIVLLEYAVH
ncbi:hypothetical protein [Microbacterium sp.]|uniref:hypothetical protein n=1 Tax=Microbacterium sp. TaxID=51671 RepID=UPI003F72B97C